MDIVIHISLAVLLLVTLYPVLHILAVSLSSGTAILKNQITFYPIGFRLNAYRLIFETPRIPRGFKNSIIYASIGTFINLVLTITMAYPLSKKRLTLRGFYTTLVVITMFFGGGLIPTFILVNSLGMYNTIWALVIPGAIATWNLIIMRTFFQAIPVELEESAYLDGAKDMTILLRIVLPLSKAAIATIGLFYLVSHWNSWFSAVIYLKDAKKYPLQLILREIVIQGRAIEEMVEQGAGKMAEQLSRDDSYISLDKIKYSVLFVSIVPMLVIYPFIQRYFVKGVMIGSLKG
jgi:putative aldouronate transport system permease protein